MRIGFQKIYKRVTLLHFGHVARDWSTAKILATFRVDLTLFGLLRYLGQLIRIGQPHTWALIQQEARWYEQIKNDLAWLQCYCGESHIPCGSEVSWENLCHWTTHEPTKLEEPDSQGSQEGNCLC